MAFKKTPPAQPSCDICQVNPVFACCREDRAFLCRACDLDIHSANASVAKHERFLISGITLELQSLGQPGRDVGREYKYTIRMTCASTPRHGITTLWTRES